MITDTSYFLHVIDALLERRAFNLTKHDFDSSHMCFGALKRISFNDILMLVSDW